MFSADLILSARVGAATEKVQVLAFVLTLGTASKFELDHRSYLCCLAGMSIESKYRGCLDEIAW